jgi:hypothetical protein
MMHRRTLAVAVVPLALGLAVTAGPTYAGQHTHRTTTPFAFKSSGFGTRVIGGQVPAGSSTTAWQGIGCTNKAGVSRSNNVTEAAVPGLGTVSGARTRVWTSRHAGRVASHSTHSIARIVLASTSVGTLSIDAIRSTAVAYHDGKGFHSRTSTRVGGLTLTPVVGDPQSLPLPTPDQPVTVPGLVTISLGSHATDHTSHSATADAYALRIDLPATGTSVRVAHSHAVLYSGFTGGIFGGRAAATKVVTAAGDIVRSGSQPLIKMPCQGTYGHTRSKSLASVDLGGQLIVKGADARVRGVQGSHRAHGWTRAEVARVSLGGQLVIDGIVGRASVVRHGRHLTTSAKGTRLGSVTVAGHKQVFPKTGVLEIPGVAKLERHVVQRKHNGIRVIGLRITLLDGSGAVINLAQATLAIRPLPH